MPPEGGRLGQQACPGAGASPAPAGHPPRLRRRARSDPFARSVGAAVIIPSDGDHTVTGTALPTRSPRAGMKWWGWGRDGVAFTHEDKPELAPFLLRHLDLDVTRTTSRPVPFASLEIPEATLSD